MSERSDARFKRALKDSANESLKGWEFTPAMRQAVLQQIANEEAASPSPAATPAPATSPGPAPASRRWLERSRPLIWIGAAAAVLVVAVNLPGLMGGFGRSSSKPSPGPMAASSKPSAGPRQAQEAPKAESATAPAGGVSEKKVADAAANSAATVQAPAAAAPSEQAQGQSASSTGYSALRAAAAPARIHLVAPEDEGAKVAVTAAPPGASIMAKSGPAEALDLVRVGSQAAVRTRESVQLYDAGGGLVWEKPLAGGSGPLAALNGKIATSAGNELYLFDTDGRQEQKLVLPQAPDSIVLSPDGRVAVTAGPVGLQRSLTLTVYQNGQIQFQVNDLGDAQTAFGPDGSLAVVGKGGLQLYSREGRLLWQSPLTGRGRGVRFAAGGDLIVAGAEGFHRSGQKLWELALRPQEVLALGPDGPVLLWEREQLTLIRPQDGTELWSAEPPAQPNRFILDVAASENGELVAVLARIDESVPAVWLLDQGGGLRYSERLNPGTFGVAVEGESLLLLSKSGPESRPVPAR